MSDPRDASPAGPRLYAPPPDPHGAEDADERDPLLELIAADPRLYLDLSYGPEEERVRAWTAAARELARRDPEHYDTSWPDAPIAAPPGTWAKVERLAVRLEAGQPLFNDDDANESLRVGFDADEADNGDKFRHGLAVETAGGGVEHVAEARPPRRRRRRTVLERVRAARRAEKEAEAARKRERRKAA